MGTIKKRGKAARKGGEGEPSMSIRVLNAVLDLKGEMENKFDAVFKKLQNHDKRFDANDRRFDAIDGKLREHDKRFEQVDRRFDRIEEKLGVVDKTLEIIRLELGEGKAAQKDLAARVVVLEGC